MTLRGKHPSLHPNPFVRHLLVAVGWISVVLGVIGLLLPVIPTTPFLLLAGGCFLRSSPRFYYWLLDHRLLGPYMRFYLNGQGIPRKAKLGILLVLWIMILTSALLIVPVRWVSIAMIVLAVGVSIYILRMPEPVIVKHEGELPDESA